MKIRRSPKFSAITAIAALGWGCGGRVLELPAEQTGSGGAPSASGGAWAEGSPALSPPSKGGGYAAGGAYPSKSQSPKAPSEPKAGAPSIGEAGAPGHAGAANAGGPNGPIVIGGSAGQGGFAPAPKCAGYTFTPTTSLLTDASNSFAIPSAIYAYSAPGLVPASTEVLTTSNGTFAGIHIKAQPGQPTDSMNGWLGVGLPLAGCVDATGYGGVKFTITGDLGRCALTFGLVTSVNNSDSFVGSCQVTTCLAASSRPLKVGTSVIAFTDMTGGSPESRVNPATLNDLQWQFSVPFDESQPECVADFTVTEISFIP
ncbi:MAG TPA: hypothetical protein VFK05_23225 [Polyangiaceae bacterium]|nr:hypothetical protein [Polyangiaceae bacterium]